MEQGRKNSTRTGRALPMVMTPQQTDAPRHAPRPQAAFLAQLLAARDHLEIQRARRRTTGDAASRAYAATGASTVMRLPAGYRRRLEA